MHLARQNACIWRAFCDCRTANHMAALGPRRRAAPQRFIESMPDQRRPAAQGATREIRVERGQAAAEARAARDASVKALLLGLANAHKLPGIQLCATGTPVADAIVLEFKSAALPEDLPAMLATAQRVAPPLEGPGSEVYKVRWVLVAISRRRSRRRGNPICSTP